MSIVLLYKSTNVSNRETAYQDIGPAFSLKSRGQGQVYVYRIIV